MEILYSDWSNAGQAARNDTRVEIEPTRVSASHVHNTTLERCAAMVNVTLEQALYCEPALSRNFLFFVAKNFIENFVFETLLYILNCGNKFLLSIFFARQANGSSMACAMCEKEMDCCMRGYQAEEA